MADKSIPCHDDPSVDAGLTVSASPSPIQSGSRAAWLLSAASLGAVAGLPWVFILQGPLISALFAGVAAYRANQLWRRSETPRVGWPLLVASVVAAIALGHPASSTWPEHCFVLNLSNEKGAAAGLLVAGMVGLAALGCLSLVERQLRRRLRRLRVLSPGQPEVAARLTSLWVGFAGLAWSITNETLFPCLLCILLTVTDHSGAFGPFRDPCNPEVGWVGAGFYALGLGLLSFSRTSKAAAVTVAEALPTRPVVRSPGVLLVALLFVQGARTFVLFQRELPQLREHGGHIDCECKKYDDTVHL